MNQLDAADIAALTGGRLADGRVGSVSSAPISVTGPVVVDSGDTVAGSLFVAVPGARVDGHDFAAAAVSRGAVLVLADRPLAGLPVVVVPNTVEALGRLAHGVLQRLSGVRVVGITGSSGKTGTKDLIAALLERLGETVAPPRSFNTEIGVPLTVLCATESTAYLVLEMGARGPGHIRELTAIARPDVSVVLNVGSAHLGEFGGRDAIAKAKAELVEALPENGLAVLNADDPIVRAMAERTTARVVTFGLDAAADVRAEGLSMHAGRARFRLVAAGSSADVALTLVGAHHVSNALAAAAVAIDAGMTTAQAAEGLSAATARSPWRMEVTDRADGVTVINDAYNANPESVRAALDALMSVAGGRRTWAVLGDMRELGADSASQHESVGVFAATLGVTRVVAVGDDARPVVDGANADSGWTGHAQSVADPDEALALLRAQLAAGDVVLVKASRAAGLERLALALAEAAG
jgi:UDP-N-acetylmuramoyl-tripeptide--D-alanyl-D-alanine ligase